MIISVLSFPVLLWHYFQLNIALMCKLSDVHFTQSQKLILGKICQTPKNTDGAFLLNSSMWKSMFLSLMSCENLFEELESSKYGCSLIYFKRSL